LAATPFGEPLGRAARYLGTVTSPTPSTSERVQNAGEQLRGHVRGVIEEVRPRLRGWLHAATAPLSLAAGVVLVALSPTAATRFGSSVFAASALTLFTVSAIFHRGNWSPRASAVLRRLDHANIFLLIAGSYTPFTLLLLGGTERTVLLSVVWGGAALYTAGGIVYGTRRPDPSPSWFGFHEVFHSLTVLAFLTHYAGVSVATYSLR
jgi:hemolysin III